MNNNYITDNINTPILSNTTNNHSNNNMSIIRKQAGRRSQKRKLSSMMMVTTTPQPSSSVVLVTHQQRRASADMLRAFLLHLAREAVGYTATAATAATTAQPFSFENSNFDGAIACCFENIDMPPTAKFAMSFFLEVMRSYENQRKVECELFEKLAQRHEKERNNSLNHVVDLIDATTYPVFFGNITKSFAAVSKEKEKNDAQRRKRLDEQHEKERNNNLNHAVEFIQTIVNATYPVAVGGGGGGGIKKSKKRKFKELVVGGGEEEDVSNVINNKKKRKLTVPDDSNTRNDFDPTTTFVKKILR